MNEQHPELFPTEEQIIELLTKPDDEWPHECLKAAAKSGQEELKEMAQEHGITEEQINEIAGKYLFTVEPVEKVLGMPVEEWVRRRELRDRKKGLKLYERTEEKIIFRSAG